METTHNLEVVGSSPTWSTQQEKSYEAIVTLFCFSTKTMVSKDVSWAG